MRLTGGSGIRITNLISLVNISHINEIYLKFTKIRQNAIVHELKMSAELIRNSMPQANATAIGKNSSHLFIIINRYLLSQIVLPYNIQEFSRFIV